MGVCHPERQVWFMRLNRDLGETISCNLVVHTINNHPSSLPQLTNLNLTTIVSKYIYFKIKRVGFYLCKQWYTESLIFSRLHGNRNTKRVFYDCLRLPTDMYLTNFQYLGMSYGLNTMNAVQIWYFLSVVQEIISK